MNNTALRNLQRKIETLRNAWETSEKDREQLLVHCDQRVVEAREAEKRAINKLHDANVARLAAEGALDSLRPLLTLIVKEVSGTPAFQLMDGAFYKALPVAMADELERLVLALPPPLR